MPDPVTGVLAGTSIIGGISQSRAAKKATNAQTAAADASIAEQRAARESFQRILSPYVQAGTPALQGLLNLTGLGGGQGTDWAGYVNGNPDALANWNALTPQQRAQFDNNIAAFGEYHYQEDGARRDLTPYNGTNANQAQEAAYGAIENSSGFQALARQGEEAILQNASATGGLRGGNTQGAIARFRPALLDQFIERQFGRLGGIASIGQNAAAGVGNAGLQTGANIGNTLVGQGQAAAAGAGAQGQIFGQLFGQLGGIGAGALGGARIQGGPAAALLPSVLGARSANPGIF